MKYIGVMCMVGMGLTPVGTARAQSPAQAGATFSERVSASTIASVYTAIECDDGSSAVVSTSITVSIHAESELGSGGSSASSSLWLDWFEFNPCDNQFRHTARIIDAPDSEQDGVHSASVVGTFELVDVTIPVGTVAIDLEWSGTGEAAGTRRHDSTERDGATVITWVHDQRRPAAVAGFVTLNDLDLPLSGEGELVSHRALELVIPR